MCHNIKGPVQHIYTTVCVFYVRLHSSQTFKNRPQFTLMMNISHSSCSTDIRLQKVDHRYRTVTPFLNKNRGHRQFKGNGRVCLHSRASSTLLKWSDSQCLWVLEAYNLRVLLWRAIDHLLGGMGYRVIVGKGWGCAVVNKRTPPPRIAIIQNPWGRRRRKQGTDTP